MSDKQKFAFELYLASNRNGDCYHRVPADGGTFVVRNSL